MINRRYKTRDGRETGLLSAIEGIPGWSYRCEVGGEMISYRADGTCSLTPGQECGADLVEEIGGGVWASIKAFFGAA